MDWKHMVTRQLRRAATLAVGGAIAGCAVLRPLPQKSGLEARLAAIPTHGLPLKSSVSIRWDAHQIPYIFAKHDEDAAFALGIVHAHLRLGQMEILRRVSQGRLSEMAGPLTVEIDHALRIINFGRSAEKTERELPDETRAWLTAFVAGVNHIVKTSKDLPHEFKVFGLDREPWTIKDVLTIGRLAGTDVNWLGWFRLLQLRKRKDWPTIWARLIKTGSDSTPSMPRSDQARRLEALLGGSSRSGSNAYAVSAARSTTGGALIASDPHLGITLPNLWLLIGVKSPSFHSVGMMIPGVPFVAVGRNEDIAWGGTNMRAASSDLYDVSKLDKASITTRTEKIRVRWWPTKTVTVRETPLGPILSDAPPLKWSGKPFALRWIGHETGDEITAMLKVMKARNWQDFRRAFKTFAVSAQNMIFADTKGNIGQVMATILPIRGAETPPDVILDPNDMRWQWKGTADVMKLPASYNPKTGFVASANNRPVKMKIPVGYFFSADDRIDRLKQLYGGAGKVGLAQMKAGQLDVYMASSVAVRDAVLKQVDALELERALDAGGRKVLQLMRDWDGHYRLEAKGPVAFELFYAPFVKAFYRRRLGPEDGARYTGFGRTKRLLAEDLSATDAATLKVDLRAALNHAGTIIDRYRNWGAMHRVALAHPLAFIPVLGERYRFGEFPAGGSSDTLLKTAHDSVKGPHRARYGQQARYVSDMSDLDKNYFALLGGQDGWLSSSTALDQVKLWQRGKYIQVPMRDSSIRKTFTRETVLNPIVGRPARK